jgi:DNA-binding transcriptional ArsR family regulator
VRVCGVPRRGHYSDPQTLGRSPFLRVYSRDMRASAAPLLALLRSQLQGELLARVLLGRTPVTIADLARDLGAPLPTVAREVNRLHDGGLLALERQGRARLVSADESNPATEPLRQLIAVTFGPRQIVPEEFADLAGLGELYIFGSWAARYGGEGGPVPGDVDVLIVGPVNRDDVYDAAERAGQRLRREVNVTVVSWQRWGDPGDAFLNEVRRRPLLKLSTGESET